MKTLLLLTLVLVGCSTAPHQPSAAALSPPQAAVSSPASPEPPAPLVASPAPPCVRTNAPPHVASAPSPQVADVADTVINISHAAAPVVESVVPQPYGTLIAVGLNLASAIASLLAAKHSRGAASRPPPPPPPHGLPQARIFLRTGRLTFAAGAAILSLRLRSDARVAKGEFI